MMDKFVGVLVILFLAHCVVVLWPHGTSLIAAALLVVALAGFKK